MLCNNRKGSLRDKVTNSETLRKEEIAIRKAILLVKSDTRISLIVSKGILLKAKRIRLRSHRVINQKNPPRVCHKSKYIQVPHPPRPVQQGEKKKRGRSLRGVKGTDLVELIPQSHQHFAGLATNLFSL